MLGDCVLGDCVLGDCVLGDCVLGDCVLGDCVPTLTIMRHVVVCPLSPSYSRLPGAVLPWPTPAPGSDARTLVHEGGGPAT